MNNEDLQPVEEIQPDESTKYTIQQAVDLAVAEFDVSESKTLATINIIARRFSPHTIAEGLEALNHDPALMGMNTQPGRILSDNVNAVCAQIIVDNLIDHVQKSAEKRTLPKMVEKEIAFIKPKKRRK